MSKKEALQAKAGANSRESLGGGQATATAPKAAGVSPRLVGIERDKESLRIPIDRIVADPDQPRRDFDEAELKHLAASLKSRGQLQPIRCRYDAAKDIYVVVAGERRWRAGMLAKLKTLAVVLASDDQSATDRLEDQLVENALRSDLKPIEQANAYKRLLDANEWTYAKLAGVLHIDKGTISKAMSLLALPEAVQEQVESGAIPATTAHEIARLPEPERAPMADRVVKDKISRKEVREAATAPTPSRAASTPAKRFVVTDDCWVTVSWKGEAAFSAVEALQLALKQAKKGK